MASLWVFPRCIEALTRAGEFDRPLLQRAITMFEVRTCDPLFSQADPTIL